MIKQKPCKCGSREITLESLPTSKCHAVFIHLARVIAGAGRGVVDFPTRKEDFSGNIHLGNIVQGVIDRLDEKGTPVFIKQLIRDSILDFRDSRLQEFDPWYEDEFSGNLDGLVALLQEVLILNFGDLGALGKKLWATVEKLAEPSSPTS